MKDRIFDGEEQTADNFETNIRPEYLDWEKDDFQEFINKNKIERMVDIRRNYENIYSTILKKGYHAVDFIFPKNG